MDDADATTHRFVLLPIPAAAERCGVREEEIRRWLAEDVLTPIPFAGDTMVNVRDVEAAARARAPGRRARTLRLHRVIGTGVVTAAILGGLVFVELGPVDLRRPWWVALCLLGLLVGLLLWRGEGLHPQRGAPRPARPPVWVPAGPGGPSSGPRRGGAAAAAFIPLAHQAAFQRLIIASGGGPILLFLHDRWSPISMAVHQELARVPVEVWVVTVDQQTELAQAVVAQTGVRAEWPQVILLRSGRAVWTATYWSINVAAVTKALKQQVPGRDGHPPTRR